ncbi:glycosyltransferase family 39 protein [Massilia endophytica]|uniref:glycosyltransferase family 39 protein n=1 Tax=Massilia endophytica TaxID=2899220 RepID=UPI001E5EC668|nr:glycosyltransferase family 39 protein [Massilia endophytica]UGQ46561.1 glycosyltransferase family 39 protein [Massilia endophytica]
MRHALPAGLLSLLALYLFLSAPTNADFWWYDASRHAMNGVFLRDLLLEGGWRAPIDFARAYYAQYPAINVGFYPPFFYLSSVPLLALFGASHAVSQAAVALYALLAGLGAYALCRRAMDRGAALAAAAILLTFPATALWARQVQLDVPALALLLAGAACLAAHLEDGAMRWLWAAAAFLGLAVLTRVQAMLALPLLLYLLLRPYPGRPPLKRRLAAVALAAVLAAPAFAMALWFSMENQALATATPGMPALASFENWTWYAARLPQALGWPAAAFIACCLPLVLARRSMAPAMRVGWLMAGVAWLFYTVVSNKDPRFNLPGYAFLFLAVAMTAWSCKPALARASLWLLLAVQLAQLAMAAVPVAAGYADAARAVQAAAPKKATVLVSAHRDGSFIYALRTLGQRRDIGVRRADKLFVDITIMRELGIRDRGLDRHAILALLDKEKVDILVVQPGYLGDQPTMREFEALLADRSLFAPIAAIPLSGQLDRSERQLLLFRRLHRP